MSRLVEGLVLVGTACPFGGVCAMAENCACAANEHILDFSCAAARGLDSTKAAQATTKTFPGMVRKLWSELGGGAVTHHSSTVQNPLGQSGVHTFVDDVITIVLASENEAEAFRNLHKFLIAGMWFEGMKVEGMGR